MEFRSYNRAAIDPPTGRLPPEGEPSPVLTASLLRRLPLATLLTESRERERAISVYRVDLDSADQARLEALWATAPPGDARYQIVAEIYREADRRGVANRTPTTTVATRLGVTHSAAAKLVARARQRGYLPPTSRGKTRSNENQEGT